MRQIDEIETLKEVLRYTTMPTKVWWQKGDTSDARHRYLRSLSLDGYAHVEDSPTGRDVAFSITPAGRMRLERLLKDNGELPKEEYRLRPYEIAKINTQGAGEGEAARPQVATPQRAREAADRVQERLAIYGAFRDYYKNERDRCDRTMAQMVKDTASYDDPKDALRAVVQTMIEHFGRRR